MNSEPVAIGLALALPLLLTLFPYRLAPYLEGAYLIVLTGGLITALVLDSRRRARDDDQATRSISVQRLIASFMILAIGLVMAVNIVRFGPYFGVLAWVCVSGALRGEFVVALRCALLEGTLGRCYAGVGVVRDSDPAAELAETETKLLALLPVLAA